MHWNNNLRLALGLGLVRVSSRARVRIRVKVRVSVMVTVSIRTRWVVNFALFRCYQPVVYTHAEVDKWVVSSNRVLPSRLEWWHLVNAYGVKVWCGSLGRWCACWLQPRVQCPSARAMDGRICAAAPLALTSQLPLPRLSKRTVHGLPC